MPLGDIFHECPPDVCTFLAVSAQSEKDGTYSVRRKILSSKGLLKRGK